MTSPGMFGLVNRFSCITRLNIHHQLKDYRKELFFDRIALGNFLLHNFILTITISKKRLGHVNRRWRREM